MQRQQLIAAVLLFALRGLAGAAGENATVEKTPERERGMINVAILIFEGVELLDFAGPAEVFIIANQGKSFRVYMVAEKKQPLKTMGGIILQPEYSVADAPQPQIIVAPGGDMQKLGAEGHAWLVNSAKKADIVMSVCMGAFLLAKAGLLDGLEATTHHWGLENLQKAAPKCKVVKGQRFVDAGKIISTGGVTAGIDGALHVVERLLGKEAAQWAADEWLEHPSRKPTPDSRK